MGFFEDVDFHKIAQGINEAVAQSTKSISANTSPYLFGHKTPILRTLFGYKIPIKFDISYKYFDDYIRISNIVNTKLGRKIHKRKPVVSENGVWFFKSSGHFNYYTQSFDTAAEKLSLCVLRDEALREIAFRDLDVFIEKDFAEAYLNKRTSECPFNRQDIEIALIKEFLNYLKTEYEKIVFEPIASEQTQLENIEEEIKNKISSVEEIKDKMRNSDFFYNKVKEILD